MSILQPQNISHLIPESETNLCKHKELFYVVFHEYKRYLDEQYTVINSYMFKLKIIQNIFKFFSIYYELKPNN